MAPIDCSPPGSSDHGILQARILVWVAIPFSWGSSRTGDQTGVSCTAGGLFISELPRKPFPILAACYSIWDVLTLSSPVQIPQVRRDSTQAPSILGNFPWPLSHCFQKYFYLQCIPPILTALTYPSHSTVPDSTRLLCA